MRTKTTVRKEIKRKEQACPASRPCALSKARSHCKCQQADREKQAGGENLTFEALGRRNWLAPFPRDMVPKHLEKVPYLGLCQKWQDEKISQRPKK
jgi:hypothetical protein